jgi:hypothetical protein
LGLGMAAESADGPRRYASSIFHSSPSASGSGNSPDDPGPLELLLAQATEGDTILLAAGEYALHSTIELAVPGLTLRGSAQSVLRPREAVCVVIWVSASSVSLEDLAIAAYRGPAEAECDRHALVMATKGAHEIRLAGLQLTGSSPTGTPGTVLPPAGSAMTGLLLEGVRAPELRKVVLTDMSGTAIQIIGGTGTIDISDSEILNSGHRAIHIVGSEGPVKIVANHIDGALNEGIFLQEVTGFVLIGENQVEDIRYLSTEEDGAGIEGGIVHTNTRGNVNTTIRGNTVDIDPHGITRASTGAELLDIDGIEVNLFGTARGFALLEGNVIRNTEDDGIDIDTRGTAELDIVIRNNVIQEVQDRAMSIVAEESSVLRAVIEDNEVTGPATLRDHPALSGDGIGIRPRQDSEVHLVVRNNELRSTGRKGIDINMNRGSGGRGPVNQAQAFFRFEGNRIDGAAQRGLDVQLEDRAVATGILLGNMIRGAAGDGIRVRSGAGDEESLTQASRLHVSVVNNEVSESATAGDAGVLARAQHLSTLCLRLAGNHSSNPAAGQDYMIRAQHDSWVELTGTAEAVEPGDSGALRASLSAAGNSGRAEEYPARLQGNSLRPPERCRFPPDDYLPELPSPSQSEPSPSPSARN